MALARPVGLLSITFILLDLIRQSLAQDLADPQLLGTAMVIRQGRYMYVFGGLSTNSTVPTNNMFQFDLNTRLWTEYRTVGTRKPSGRMFHFAQMSNDGRYMIVTGGIACFQRIRSVSLEKGLKEYHMDQDAIEYSTALKDVWMFDFVTKEWMEMNPGVEKDHNRGKCPTADGNTKLKSGTMRRASLALLPTLLLAALVSWVQ